MDIGKETASAYAAFAAGRHGEAAERVTRVLRRAPGDPGALTLLGRLALARREPDAAVPIFEKLAARHPQVAAVWADLTLALRDLGRPADAVEAAQRALRLDRRSALTWTVLGELHLSMNQPERAAAAFGKALKLVPDDPGAFLGLTLAQQVPAESDLVRRMKSLAESSRLSPSETAQVHYALAQVYKQADRDEDFIRHLFAANERQRSLSRAAAESYDAVFDALERVFTRDSLSRSARAEPAEPTPIFVLGMPRSGTTLVERLLASHPEVTAGGEIDYVRGPLQWRWKQRYRSPFPEGYDTLPASELSAMARGLTRRLSLIDSAARYVTDKTPGNFNVLGLLRILFPEGRVVHVIRDPMDTCFSILQHPFDDRSPHTCDMQLLAHFYRRYRRLMDRWRELLEDEFVTVGYERLVAAPAEEGTRLFEHCGLAWNDDYLEFHRAGGAVRTFSAMQVRRPIYRSSVGAWRRYADHLAPLLDALGDLS